MLYRKILFLCLGVILLISSILPAMAEGKSIQNRVDWDQLLVMLRAIEKEPSDKNAVRFLSLIPQKHTQDQFGDLEKFLDAIDSSKEYWQLLEKGNPLIAESAFRLMAFILPGAFYEDFFIELGKLATNHPRLFLQLLKKYEHNFPYEYPVTMTEILDIVPDVCSDEDWKRQGIERLKLYERRLRALKSVRDEDLLEVRDKCIKILEEIIKEINKIYWRYGKSA